MRGTNTKGGGRRYGQTRPRDIALHGWWQAPSRRLKRTPQPRSSRHSSTSRPGWHKTCTTRSSSSQWCQLGSGCSSRRSDITRAAASPLSASSRAEDGWGLSWAQLPAQLLHLPSPLEPYPECRRMGEEALYTPSYARRKAHTHATGTSGHNARAPQPPLLGRGPARIHAGALAPAPTEGRVGTPRYVVQLPPCIRDGQIKAKAAGNGAWIPNAMERRASSTKARRITASRR